MKLSEIQKQLGAIGISATDREIIDRLAESGISEAEIDAIEPGDMDDIIKMFSSGSIAPTSTPAPTNGKLAAPRKGKPMARTQRKQLEQPRQVENIPVDVPFNPIDSQLQPIAEAIGLRTQTIDQAANALAYLDANFGSLVIQRSQEIVAQTGRTSLDFSAYLADARSGMTLINEAMARHGFAGWDATEEEADASAA